MNRSALEQGVRFSTAMAGWHEATEPRLSHARMGLCSIFAATAVPDISPALVLIVGSGIAAPTKTLGPSKCAGHGQEEMPVNSEG